MRTIEITSKGRKVEFTTKSVTIDGVEYLYSHISELRHSEEKRIYGFKCDETVCMLPYEEKDARVLKAIFSQVQQMHKPVPKKPVIPSGTAPAQTVNSAAPVPEQTTPTAQPAASLEVQATDQIVPKAIVVQGETATGPLGVTTETEAAGAVTETPAADVAMQPAVAAELTGTVGSEEIQTTGTAEPAETKKSEHETRKEEKLKLKEQRKAEKEEAKRQKIQAKEDARRAKEEAKEKARRAKEEAKAKTKAAAEEAASLTAPETPAAPKTPAVEETPMTPEIQAITEIPVAPETIAASVAPEVPVVEETPVAPAVEEAPVNASPGAEETLSYIDIVDNTAPEHKSKRFKKSILIFIIVLAVLALAALGYYKFIGTSGNPIPGVNTTNEDTQYNDIDVMIDDMDGDSGD